MKLSRFEITQFKTKCYVANTSGSMIKQLTHIPILLQTASSSGDPHVHIIKQVKPTDEGLYTCIAGNVLGQATASAYLEVNAAVRQLSFDSCNLLFLLLLILIAQNQLWINRLRRPLMAES